MSDAVVGLLADTHGLMRPEAMAALRGCDVILHAGDVGGEDVLMALRRLAPLHVVRGNNDRGAWADRLAPTAVIEVAGYSIYLLHDLHELTLEPLAAGFDVVVSGHSHRPRVEESGGVLFVNPGSAGPRRFRLPIGVARLRLGAGRPAAELIELRV